MHITGTVVSTKYALRSCRHIIHVFPQAILRQVQDERATYNSAVLSTYVRDSLCVFSLVNYK